MVIRYSKLILAVMMYVAFASGAAKEHPASTERLIRLMYPDNIWNILERSSDLYMGIQHLFGARDVEKNSKKAEGFFLSVQKTGSSQITLKSQLYIALLHFMGEGEIKKDYKKAFKDANEVFVSRAVERKDHLRAYVLMDEIWHTAGTRRALDCGERVVNILSQSSALVAAMYYEVYYRLARNFFCDDGVSGLCSAVMCLNSLLQRSDRQSESLKKDINSLRLQTSQVLESQRANGIDIGTDLLFKAPDPEPYVVLEGDPFIGLYSSDSSSGDGEGSSSRSEDYESSSSSSDELEPDGQIFARQASPPASSLNEL